MSTANGDSLIEYIEQSRFFSSLPKEKLLELESQFSKVEIAAGYTLFSIGETSDYVYILIKGQLIATLPKDGVDTVVGTISPIETVGELGVFSGELRSLTVRAVSDSELLRLPSNIFKELCFDFPTLLAEVTKFVIQRAVKVIKLISHEKHNVSIILPIIENIPINSLCERFQKSFSEHANVRFLNAKETTTEEISHAITLAQSENKHIFIFMSDWKQDVIRNFIDKLSHVYVIFNEGERLFNQNSVKKIFYDLNQITNIRLELILFHPDNTKNVVNTLKWLTLANFKFHYHVRHTHQPDFDRLIRFMTGSAFTLVLGGGAGKGIAHLGVLKALLERKIPIDAIGGTSIGAGVGACFAITQNYAQTLRAINNLKIASSKTILLRNLTWPLISLYSAQQATKELIRIVGNLCIEDLWLPFFAISANLSEKQEAVHTRGFVWQAVRSSVSIPGILPPVVIDGQLHFDGGLLNNLPVETMRKFAGINQTVIASSLSRRSKYKENYHFPSIITRKEAILHSLGLGYKEYVFPSFLQTFLDALLLGSSAQEDRNCVAADILIRPDLTKFASLISKNDIELLEIGYKETLKALDEKLLVATKKAPPF